MGSRVVARSLACGLGLLAGVAEAQTRRANDIVVTAEPEDNGVRFAKLPASSLDIPQSVSSVDADEIQRRGVATLTDALRTVPGISLGAGETSWQGNNLILRGFTTRNDMFLDGMRDYGYYFRDPFNDAEIQVLKGPSSVLFGRGATGGVIHQVSKQPLTSALAGGQINLGTDGTRRVTVDVNVPLDAATAIRVDAMATRTEVQDRDGALNRRWGVAPSLGLGLGTSTRLMLSYLHQSEDNRPDYGIPWFDGAPAKVTRDTYYGFSTDYLDTDVDIGTARFEHDFSDTLSLHTQARYSSAKRSFRTSEAVIPAGTAMTTPLTAISVTRNEFSGFSNDRFLQGQLDATGRFTTGPLAHRLVFGIEGGHERPAPTYIFHVGVIGTTLVNPPAQAFAQMLQYVRLTAATRANTFGAYALDTISVGEHFDILAGLRWDNFDAHYRSTGFSPAGATLATTDLERENHRFSGRAAVTYKLDARSSLYLTYANSFNPSAEGIESLVSAGRSVAQANVNAAPETSRIWEAGAKRALFGDALLLSGSLFRIVKSNVRIPDPVVTGFNTNGGRQRVQGVELEAAGQITPAWSVHLSYAFLDSETLRTENPTAAGSPRIGEDLTITPRNSFSLQTDYALTSKLSIGGGAIYQSSRLGQNTNASLLRAPGYAIYELRARYRVAGGIALQANLFNLTDKLYYDQLHPFHVVPGAGRSAAISLILDTP